MESAQIVALGSAFNWYDDWHIRYFKSRLLPLAPEYPEERIRYMIED